MKDYYIYDLIEVREISGKLLCEVFQYSPNNHVLLVLEDIDSSYSYVDNPTFEISLSNFFINEEKTIRCKEYYIEDRITSTFRRWADKEHKQKRNDFLRSMEEKVIKMNSEISDFLNDVSNILNNTLSINDEIDWNVLKDKREYSISKPSKPNYSKIINYPQKPEKKAYEKYPNKPNPEFLRYRTKFTFWDKLSPKRKQEKIESAKRLFDRDLQVWENNCKDVDRYNEKCDVEFNIQIKEYEKQLSEAKKKKKDMVREYNLKVEEWQKNRSDFYEKQEKYNNKIDENKEAYKHHDSKAIICYNEMVLENSSYPDLIDKLFHLEYLEECSTLVVDYLFPHYDKIPTIKEYKYIKTRNEISEKKRSNAEINSIYENICYQVVIRTIHEVFEADVADAINDIVLNGYVNEINPAIGVFQELCTVTVKVNKNDFQKINLEHIEPKKCFRDALKGKSGAKLGDFTKIIPILESSRNYNFERKIVEEKNLSERLLAPEILKENPQKESSELTDKCVFNFAVKGLIYRNKECQDAACELKVGDTLLLEKESENIYDKYAIKVLTENKHHIGYVEKAFSERFSEIFENLNKCIVTKVYVSSNSLPSIYAEAFFEA